MITSGIEEVMIDDPSIFNYINCSVQIIKGDVYESII